MLRMKLHRFNFRGDMQLNVQRQGYVQRKIVSAENVKKIVAVPSLGRVPYSGACLDYTQSGANMEPVSGDGIYHLFVCTLHASVAH